MSEFHGTTILCVRKDNDVVIVGDGQVSLGNTIMKSSAVKVRRLGQGRVLSGFAGSTADAFSLFEKFESKLKDFSGNITRAAVELAKDWRADRTLRRLEALLLVADTDRTFVLSGSGDVIEPDEGIAAIGSGGMYALSAAKGLVRHCEHMTAREIALAAMGIAAEICVFTNDRFHLEEITGAPREIAVKSSG
ncbi:MAG: ATP-dependent protease subunit HslV [Myxococcales bacterium]|nr:ATP-dependent protease subunit HslV [Myxococcales bacterium]